MNTSGRICGSILVVGSLLSACSLDVGVEADPAWEAVIVAALGIPLTGQAAAVTRSSGTEMSVLVDGGMEGEALGWWVRQGRCDGTGSRVGTVQSYPPLVMSEGGVGEVEVFVTDRMVSGRTYSIEVRASGDESASILACGVFVEVDV